MDVAGRVEINIFQWLGYTNTVEQHLDRVTESQEHLNICLKNLISNVAENDVTARCDLSSPSFKYVGGRIYRKLLAKAR
jgi:hypothetical protein